MARPNSTLTQERLRELLHYDPETGIFTWRVNRGCVKAGAVAGSYMTNGYLHFGIDGRTYMNHRLAWLYVHGEMPPDMIDHVNHIKDDNRIANLRLADMSLNKQNQKRALSNNKSGFLGVHYAKGWRAAIRIDGKQVHLGRFKTPEEAHQAYLAAKRRFHAGCTI